MALTVMTEKTRPSPNIEGAATLCAIRDA